MAGQGGDIVLRGVDKIFKGGSRAADYQALSQIDLHIVPGEFVCLLGPSGCGKTTLLNLIAGFERPTHGSVKVDGLDVTHPSADRGVIFQSERALFDWLTVEENIAFGPRIRGIPSAEWSAEVEENLRLVGLDAHRHKLPRELSGGMKQRVQIARALSNKPNILLMDEPFGALDAYTRQHLQTEVERIWSELNKTIVFVTHDIGEAIRLADRVLVMNRGPGSRIFRETKIDLARPRLNLTGGFIDYHNALTHEIDQMHSH